MTSKYRPKIEEKEEASLDGVVDAKLVEKINKLLRLAKDGGATEGEANNAMSMAQKVMEANNLDMATVEAAGQNAGDDAARKKSGVAQHASMKYQRNLMAAIAETNYCYVTVVSVLRGNSYKKMGYNIIGRKANVAATKVMFDYLMTTINRIVLIELNGDNTQRMSRYARSFCEGMGDRLCVRLKERHEAYLKEQAREANERKAASRHPAAASTSNAVVVVMNDFAQAERDFNEDFRYGWERGTTARKRAEATAAYNRRMTERAERIAAGMDPEVADWMSYGYSEEEATDKVRVAKAKEKASETPEQRARREAREERQSEAFWRRAAKEAAKRDPAAYARGKEAAEDVSLDKQVDRTRPAPAGTKLID